MIAYVFIYYILLLYFLLLNEKKKTLNKYVFVL
jgi:hypothetical protein